MSFVPVLTISRWFPFHLLTQDSRRHDYHRAQAAKTSLVRGVASPSMPLRPFGILAIGSVPPTPHALGLPGDRCLPDRLHDPIP